MRSLILCLFMFASSASANPEDAATLAALLDEFLAGATVGSVEMHQRFWSDDLVYTSSSGTRTDKAEIVAGMRSSLADRPAEPAVVYSAEDVDVRVYGDMAVVAFRLVGTNQAGDRSEYFNTGTFRKHGGEWRAVAWQATRIPPPD